MGLFTGNKNLDLDQTDYLADVQLESYSEYTSVMEDTMYAYAESERAWMEMMQGVALQELAVLESTGSEMIYEAADIKGFFDKVINWFKGLWSKIAGIFSKFITQIGARLSDDKKFVEKYRNTVLKGQVNIPADGFDFKGHLFENLNKVSYAGAIDAWSKYTSMSGENYMSALNQEMEERKAVTKEYIAARKTNRTANMDKVRAAALGNGSTSIEQGKFVKEATKYLMGTSFETFKNQFDYNDICNEIANAKETKNVAKKAYTDLKKTINDAIKNIENIKKACIKKEDKSEGQDLRMSYANEIITDLKQVSTIYSTLNGVQLKCLNARYNQAKAIAYKLISYAKKSVKESAESDDEIFGFNFDLV